MRHFALMVIAWLLLAGAVCAERPPGIEVLHMPHEGLPRFLGDAPEGMTIPLSEVALLLERASAAGVEPGSTAGLSIHSVSLDGPAADPLKLDGVIRYRNASTARAALMVSAVHLPLVWQDASSGSGAHLLSWRGGTWLLAEPGASGELPFRMQPEQAEGGGWTLPPWSAPSHVRLALSDGDLPGHTPLPALLTESPGSRHWQVWPRVGEPAVLRLKEAAALELASIGRARLERTVRAEGAALLIEDRFFFTGTYDGGGLRLAIPANTRLLSFDAMGDSSVVRDGSDLVLSARNHGTEVGFEARLLIDDPDAPAGAWQLDDVVREDVLTLAASGTHRPVVVSRPGSLIELEPQSDGARRFSAPGGLPSLQLALMPLARTPAPSVFARVDFTRVSATATFSIDLQQSTRGDIEFTIPESWSLASASAVGGGGAESAMWLARGRTAHRLLWEPGTSIDGVSLTLRRPLIATTGEPAPIELPVLGMDPSPIAAELVLTWPESLEVQPGDLTAMDAVPASELILFGSTSAGPSMAFRLSGPEAAGVVRVSARAPDLRATVATLLSVEEDRTIVRSTIQWDVRFAATKSFTFMLPAGTGASGLRIDGTGIRESTSRQTDAGEVWTVQTQYGVEDQFAVTLEWPLTSAPGAVIEAPAIEVLDVSSQRGWIALEASPTLRLTTEVERLSEADPFELPPVAWKSGRRLLGVWRYLRPPYRLAVTAERFQSEESLRALVTEAALTTTLAAEGERFTEATYSVLPLHDRQFFELRLPAGAELWSVLVDGKGEKPSLRHAADGTEELLVPLPSAMGGQPVAVRVLYREVGKPLDQLWRLQLNGPDATVPVNKTTWNLHLPRGFEYLSFEGTFGPAILPREPLARFLRTAYYPPNIIFPGARTTVVFIISSVTAVGALIVLALFAGYRRARIARQAAGLPVEAGGGCTGRIIELLIGLAIIAILVAIAVPNFLEAQTRSKVSRVRSDLRSMATAIETYFVDHQAYPAKLDSLWQGSVKYITSNFADPNAPVHGSGFRYFAGHAAYDRLKDLSVVAPPRDVRAVWMLYSVGPDRLDDDGRLLYDPTNGTISPGDTIRWGGEGLVETSGPMMRGKGESDTAGQSRVRDIKIIDGHEQAADGLRQEATPSSPPPPSVADEIHAKAGEEKLEADFDDRERKNAHQVYTYTDAFHVPEEIKAQLSGAATRFLFSAAAEAGLLSLDIEVPQGGIHRRFEGLFSEARLDVRLMDDARFKRLRFLGQFLAFLALLLLWTLHRERFASGLLLLAGLGLLLPLIAFGPFAAFFNAVVQGCILALAVPVAARVWKRLAPRRGAVTALALLALFPLAASAQEPLRVVAPYHGESERPDTADPAVFIDRATFEELWNRAHTVAGPLPGGERPAAFTDVQIDGRFDAGRGEIVGTILVSALNTSGEPRTLPLALGALRLTPGAGSRAQLSAGADGYLLTIPPDGVSTASLSFHWPVERQPRGGRATVRLPESGSGAWRIAFDDPAITASTCSGARIQPASDGAIFSGVLRPGNFCIEWREHSGATTPGGSAGWKASISQRVRWTTTTHAEWEAVLHIEPMSTEQPLPGEVTVELDAAVRPMSVSGVAIVGLRESDSRLALELGDGRFAALTLTGAIFAPASGPWTFTGIRVPGAARAAESVRFDIADSLTVPRVQADGIRRRSPRALEQGFASYEYEGDGAPWTAEVEVRRDEAAFNASISEVVSLVPGLPLRAAQVTLVPVDSVLFSAMLTLPAGAEVLAIGGGPSSGFVQLGEALEVTFAGGASEPVVFGISMRFRQEAALVPLRVPAARRSEQSLCVAVPMDVVVEEVTVSGATPQPPAGVHRELLAGLGLSPGAVSLRSWSHDGGARLELLQRPSPRSALTTVFNRVTLKEGAQSLRAVVRSEPRRGRLDSIRARVLLAVEEEGALARLEVSGPVRSVQKQLLSPGEVLVVAHLTEPSTGPAEIVISLDQPYDTGATGQQAPTVVLPVEDERVRALLLLRREFEGQFADVDPRGSRAADAATLDASGFGAPAAPSDLAFELGTDAAGVPALRVQRHRREQAVRAVVEVLRLRVIATEDGFERHELELAVQNESEQFLRLALPAAKSEIDVYELRVSDAVVPAAFGSEGGRDVLLVPLVRTGLLKPELNIRVAYTVTGRPPLRSGTPRRQALPEVLGNVPVSQSALILMLPSTWSYSKFEGSLNQVELLDLQVDETLRRARKIEQLSEGLLAAGGGADVGLLQEATRNLSQLQDELEQSISSVDLMNEAYGRELRRSGEKAQKDAGQQALVQEREQNLGIARRAQSTLASNTRQLANLYEQAPVQPRAAQTAAPMRIEPPPAAPAPPISFPQYGDVFAFRQLQGTGSIEFTPKSRVAGGARWDLGFGVLLVAGLMVLALFGPRVVSGPGRKLALVVVVALALLLLDVAKDAAVMALVAAAAWLAYRKMRAEKAPEEVL